MADARTLVYSRSKLAIMLVLGLLGAALSVVALEIVRLGAVAGQPIAVVLALTCVIGIAGSLALVIFAARRMVSGGEAANYNEEGLTVTTLIRTHRWEWNEIEAFGLQDAFPNHILKTKQLGSKMKSYPLIGIVGVDRTIKQWFAEMLQEWPPNKSRAKRLATGTKNLGH